MTDSRIAQLQELENTLGVFISDKILLDSALTHSSYTNEKGLPRSRCYENLEFFGDSILSFVVSEDLFKKQKRDEGVLSRDRAKLVCENSLYKIALKYDIEKYIRVSAAVTRIDNHIPKSILADVIEAIIAAIYLSNGLASATSFVLREIYYLINETDVLSVENTEPKSKLQEYVQKRYKVLPEYRLKKHVKLDHDNLEVFHVMVYINGKFISVGSGGNHKLAEKNAAEKALNFLSENPNVSIPYPSDDKK